MDLLRDIRVTVRHLVSAPVYTAAAVVTLALAIGATSAIYGAVHAVLLSPLPIEQPDDLVIGWATDPSRNQEVVEFSYRNVQDWQADSRSFVHLAAMGSSAWPAVLEGRGDPARLSSVGVTASFFQTLGVLPLHGRVFRPEDDRPNAPRVIVLSHATWVRRFGGDPGVLGTVVRLGEQHTIVGVMPEGFDFPRGTDYWTPVLPVLTAAADRWGDQLDVLQHVGVLFVIGRLRDGATSALAAEELNRLAAAHEEAGVPRFGSSVVVTPFLDYLIGPARQALWWLSGAVAVLLLIACANVSGLMLARVTLRRHEQAVRRALGATGARIGRMWAIEAALLALAGGAAGLIAAHWIAAGIVALGPEDVPRLAAVSIDLRVAAFTFAVMVTTALLCGIGPILQARSQKVAENLNDAAPGSVRSHRARSLLVTLQIALAVVLLVTAGLVVRSFGKLRQIEWGFDPASVLTMRIEPRSATSSANRWLLELIARVEAMPEVRAAGGVYLRPLAFGPIGLGTWVLLEGQPETDDARRLNPTLNYQVATPGYFRAMRIPLKQGRLFTDRDDERSPRVSVVSESAARRLWPGQDPIGRRVLMPSFSSDDPSSVWRTVVGVVADVRYLGLDDVQLDVYDSAPQASQTASDLAIRTAGDPLAIVAAVRDEARRHDPHVLVDGITTMNAVVARALAPWRFSSWLFGLFAVAALALAAVGLSGLVGLDAAQRSREFAVRIALGAGPRDILGRVIGPSGLRLIAGLSLGLVAAGIGTRGIEALLYGVGSRDPLTYGAVIVAVAGIVGVASLLPARRALAIDPVAVLRRE